MTHKHIQIHERALCALELIQKAEKRMDSHMTYANSKNPLILSRLRQDAQKDYDNYVARIIPRLKKYYNAIISELK